MSATQLHVSCHLNLRVDLTRAELIGAINAQGMSKYVLGLLSTGLLLAFPAARAAER